MRQRNVVSGAVFLEPVLGGGRIEELTRSHVIYWVNRADELTQDDGSTYASATRKGWWRVLKQMLPDLKAEFGLMRDPTERVKPPSKDGGGHRERRTLSDWRMREFLAMAERL